jgi:hypothetical protein
MDILVLSDQTYAATSLVQNVKSIEWIERYQEPGEFTITTDATDAMRNQLYLGALITHSETFDIMMIENHQIDESVNEDPVLTVTGRSLFAFLENRMATGNNFPQKNPVTDEIFLYDFPKDTTINNTKKLLSEHIGTANTFGATVNAITAADTLPNVVVTATFTGSDSTREMVVKRGQLYREVARLLEEMGAGLKIIRPAPGTSGRCTWQLHKGTDVSSLVIFSADYGDLDSTKYFWSIKKKKNAALVTGAYTQTVMRSLGGTGFNMRVLYVDAGDYDFKPVSPSEIDAATNILIRRGNEELANYPETTLLETKIVANTRYTYRKDYDIGDIVWVRGNYGISQKMRVVEFAEFEDEFGRTGIPTLRAV